MTTLGYMYEEGLGVSKSEEKAAALYLKAANHED
jgi:TPR repeat protein